MKTFYKMTLSPTEGGLSIWTDRFYSVHETKCYYFCIHQWEKVYINTHLLSEGVTAYEQLKNRKSKFKRIHKTCSRIAFDTKQEAYDSLIYRKKKHLEHINRDMKMISAFMKFNENSGYADLKSVHGQDFIPDTEDLVNECFIFD